MSGQHRAWAGDRVAPPSSAGGRHRAVLTARPTWSSRLRLLLVRLDLELPAVLADLGMRRRRALARARGRFRVHAYRHCWDLSRPWIDAADRRALGDAALIVWTLAFASLGFGRVWTWLS